MASLNEILELSLVIRDDDYWAVVEVLRDPARRWFFSGQGRSGLVAAMVAMRFMQIGRRCHVAGEATAPSIRSGDGLLVVSGSGSTATSARHAEVARQEKALVVAVTRVRESPIANLSSLVLHLPVVSSEQLGGDVFEHAALVVLDSVVTTLGRSLHDAPAELRSRHANLQ
jgi:6-phospho-3-hexuloisomerase